MVGILVYQVGMVLEDVCRKALTGRRRAARAGNHLFSMLQELTPRAQDSLVSFGERLSTRLFASYLRSQVCHKTNTRN